MATTQKHMTTPAGEYIATYVTDGDIKIAGRVTINPSGRTFRAARRVGTASDLRRIADGFRTIDAACRWIEASV